MKWKEPRFEQCSIKRADLRVEKVTEKSKKDNNSTVKKPE